ncbi:hypothetical protein PGIGA_G00096080 [Pangasianodon gigas]|uniref:Uncharacterized protein n=1 Tax=Pangasianodon gigas TaxID=30993 RepID=A0ACC5XEB4_PANGG|nr:hypothetical protein [Pangasianodon gigas]
MQSTRSEAEISPSIKGDNFFVQIGANLHGLPKLKRYIQFTQFECQPSAQSLSLPVITESVTPALLTKMQSKRSEDKVSPTIMGADFFGQTGSSFDGMPKVKRYIQFTQAEPHLQPPLSHSLTNRTEKTIHANSELKMKALASEDYIQPAAGEHNFFGPIGASTEIPKVKRYIQFSQRSTQPSSRSLHRQTATPVLTKPELGRSSSSPVDSKSNNEDTFFKKMDASISELPKVKRYIQFTHQHSTPPKSSNTHGVTEEVAKKRELWGSNLSIVDVKPPVREDNFFGQLGTNLNSLPRVKRYIQFTQAKPYSSGQSQSPNEKMTKKEWKTLSSSTDKEAKSSTKDTFFDGVSLDNIPKVKKALQFTQSENQNITANDKSSNAADNLFGSLDLSFNQLPKVKRNVHTVQSEPYRSYPVPSKFLSRSNLESERSFPSEDEFKLTTKENYSFGQIDGVPRLNRYIQFRQSEPQTQTLSPALSSQKWESVDVGTESRMLNQLPKPRRSPFSSNPDAYGQPDQVFIQAEEVFRQTSSNPSSGDKKYANTQGSSSRTVWSTTESETILESKLPSLRASSEERQTRKRLVMDPALQDASQSITDTPAASSEKDDAREYLRDSSLARQRQERRRFLFQQKRRAMDGFSVTSDSFTSQESNQ